MASSQQLQLNNTGSNPGVMAGAIHGDVIVNPSISEKRVSAIACVIRSIVNNLPSSIPTDSFSVDPYTIESKLIFNDVIKYREIISDYSMYSSLCDSMLNTYDDTYVGRKKLILDIVHQWYILEKGDILLQQKDSGLSEIELIKRNSDALIDAVKEKIAQTINNDPGTSTLTSEEIDLGMTYFICYCFMECKILERPV